MWYTIYKEPLLSELNSSQQPWINYNILGFENLEVCTVFSNYAVSLGFDSSVNRNWALRILLFEIRVCLDFETAQNSFTSRRESSLPNRCN